MLRCKQLNTNKHQIRAEKIPEWISELNTSNSGVAFLVTQQYIICLQRQETQVWTLGREDALETGEAAHPRVLASVLHVCPKLQFFAILHSVQPMGSRSDD